jgi:hypothetical protein
MFLSSFSVLFSLSTYIYIYFQQSKFLFCSSQKLHLVIDLIMYLMFTVMGIIGEMNQTLLIIFSRQPMYTGYSMPRFQNTAYGMTVYKTIT